mmetsp:Transcript_144521/g.277254  ORF Transcript_144521/g.277254 Transcript_144521/m.277254 type:complete len:1540 (-) Transcript_144521:127-4746(-)
MSATCRGNSRGVELLRGSADSAAGEGLEVLSAQSPRHASSRPRSRPPTCRETRETREGAQSEVQISNVRVVCRLRPLNEREKKLGTTPAATASTERKEVAVNRFVGGTRQQRSTFHLDDVLTSFSTQEDVFASTIKPFVNQVLSGYEATAFAYGQTGTGKTYTMEGDLGSEEGRGLVPRAAAAIINQLSNGEFTEHSITVSYLEIYNEELSDLLAPPQQQVKLDLKDVGGGRGVVCVGLSEVPVTTLEQILNLISRAQERRRVAETRINARSSRSHCIFTMKVRCRRKVSVGEFENVGKLHLVDLAGSECAKKAGPPSDEQPGAGSAVRNTQAQAAALEEERERRNINQSLLTLGRVIAALRDNTGRVPYRDSKLTRLLQDALGGRCKTVVIATISPAMSAVDETISALSYAEQASGIKNRPVASSLLRTTRMPTPAELAGTGTSGCGAADWAEMEMKIEYLQQEVVEAQQALARKFRESQEFLDRAESAEGKLTASERERDEALEKVEESQFVRDRLFEFTERQAKVASSFQAAFEAAEAHGQDVTALLATRCSTAALVRQQARELCAEDEKRVPKLTAASKQMASEAREHATAVHAAHTDADNVAKEAATAQHQLLKDFLSAAKDARQQWDQQLQAGAAQACAALEAHRAASDTALAEIDVAASAAADAVTKGASEVQSAAEQGERMLGQQADALQADLSSEQEMLVATASSIAQDFEDVCAATTNAGQRDAGKLQGTVRKPLDALKSSLQFNLDATSKHATELRTLKEQNTTETRLAAERREKLLEAVADAAAKHAAAAAASPPPLWEALEALRTALHSRSDAAMQSLSSASKRLSDAKSSLTNSTDTGRAGIDHKAASADALLKAFWEEQHRGHDDLSTALVKAASEQRAGNAASTLQGAGRGTEQALTEVLVSALQQLEASRADVARDVLELQEQRSAEQKSVALLTQQRESLQAEVATARADLKDARSELAETQAQLVSLKDSQQRNRLKALENIKELVEREMNTLGNELDEGTAAACSRLGSTMELVDKVEANRLPAAEKQSTSTGVEAAQVIKAWSEGVETKCGTITTAQQRAQEAAERVAHGQAMTVERLKCMEVTSTKWGEKAEEVAQMADKAVIAVRDLQAAREAVEPRWAEVQKDLVRTASVWAEGDQVVSSALDSIAADTTCTSQELGKLGTEITHQHKLSCDSVTTWSQNDKAHQAVLDGVKQLGAESNREGAAAEAQHAVAIDAVSEEALDLSNRASNTKTSAGTVLEAVDAFAGDIPSVVEATVSAVGKVGSRVADLTGREKETLARATSAFADIHKLHSKTVGCMQEGALETSRNVAGSCQNVITTACSHKAASVATISQACSNWEKLKTNSASAQGDAEASAKEVLDKVEHAVTETKKCMATALQGGATAHGRALEAILRLLNGSSTGFSEQHEAWLTGLTAEPLAAFQETHSGEIVPSWPQAAARPDLAIDERPCEDQLVFEFREARVAKEMEQTNASPTAKANASPTTKAGDEKISKKGQILSLVPGTGHRVVLGELNK